MGSFLGGLSSAPAPVPAPIVSQAPAISKAPVKSSAPDIDTGSLDQVGKRNTKKARRASGSRQSTLISLDSQNEQNSILGF